MSAGRAPRIVGSGAVTPCGIDAVTSAFVARTSSLDPVELDVIDDEGRAINAYRVDAIDPQRRGCDRLLSLAVPALAQALAGWKSERLPMFLALPEAGRPGGHVIDEQSFYDDLVRKSGAPIDLARTQAARVGRAGGAWAFEAALALARAGQHAVVGAVDSLLDIETLAWLDGTERLATADRDGIVPSESAAFLLIGPSDVADDTLLIDARYFHGDQMAERASAWISAASSPAPPWLVTDLDGLPRRAVALARERMDGSAPEVIAQCDLAWLFGDVGAAAVPLLVAYADIASRAGFTPAQRSIVRAGGLDLEGIGAVLLATENVVHRGEDA